METFGAYSMNVLAQLLNSLLEVVNWGRIVNCKDFRSVPDIFSFAQTLMLNLFGIYYQLSGDDDFNLFELW